MLPFFVRLAGASVSTDRTEPTSNAEITALGKPGAEASDAAPPGQVVSRLSLPLPVLPPGWDPGRSNATALATTGSFPRLASIPNILLGWSPDRGSTPPTPADWREWHSPLPQDAFNDGLEEPAGGLPQAHLTESFAQGLLAGANVTFHGMGASITRGGEGRSGWLRQLFDWLDRAFPGQTTFATSGGSGTNGPVRTSSMSGATVEFSRYMAMCELSSHLDHHLSLIILDLGVPGVKKSDLPHAEGLIRALLSRHPRPALLIVFWFDTIQRQQAPVPQNIEIGALPSHEASLKDLARHYNIPSFSVASMLWSWSPELAVQALNRTTSPWHIDGRHMTTAGQTLMAASLITIMNRALHLAWDTSHAHRKEIPVRELSAAVLPQSLFSSENTSHETSHSVSSTRCFLGDDLRKSVLKSVGFRWTVEHSSTGTPQPGLVSWASEDSVLLRLGPIRQLTIITIAYLRSYNTANTQWAHAQAQCLSPCICALSLESPSEVSAGMDAAGNDTVSITVWQRMVAPGGDPLYHLSRQLRSQWNSSKAVDQCVLQVRNAGSVNGTHHANAKFKLLAVFMERKTTTQPFGTGRRWE